MIRLIIKRGGFKWWSNHLECGFEMIKMGASENRGFTPNIWHFNEGNHGKPLDVGVPLSHADLVKQQNEECFEVLLPKKCESPLWGKEWNMAAGSVFPAGCLYVVSQLPDTYLSTKNFASRGCELTSPKRHCSPSVRNSLHTSPQTLAQALIRNDFKNRGPQNQCNLILYSPILPPFKWPGLEKPHFLWHPWREKSRISFQGLFPPSQAALQSG